MAPDFIEQQTDADRSHLPADAGMGGFDLQPSALGAGPLQPLDALLIGLGWLDDAGVFGVWHGPTVGRRGADAATAGMHQSEA